jgi:DUF177 domain-containing protein
MGNEGLNALREVSKLSVDVSDLLTRPGTSRRLEFTEELIGLGLDMGQVRTELRFDLLLESLVEGILVSGQVRGAFALACIRCLRDFESPFDVSMNEILAYEGMPGAEEGYQIVADHAHLEPVVRDAVMLAMPINPLHAPDCKGLCPACGADRNEVDCGHRLERTDLRWEPLAELKKKLEG